LNHSNTQAFSIRIINRQIMFLQILVLFLSECVSRGISVCELSWMCTCVFVFHTYYSIGSNDI